MHLWQPHPKKCKKVRSEIFVCPGTKLTQTWQANEIEVTNAHYFRPTLDIMGFEPKTETFGTPNTTYT
jgi:hypothetical protein